MVYDGVLLLTMKPLNLIWLSILFATDDVGVKDSAAVCMEDQLRSLGILHNTDDHMLESILKLAISKGIDLEANISQKKVHADLSFSLIIISLHKMAVLLFFWFFFSFNVSVLNPHCNFLIS